MKVELLHSTPLYILVKAIRTCWDSFDKGDNLGEKDLNLIDRVCNKYKHECYHPETELLTENGWVKIENIKKDDKVLTYNKDTNRTELQNVLRTFKYDYDGELIEFKNRNIDLLVTPNHKVFASKNTTVKNRKKPKFELIEAQDIENINHKHLLIAEYENINNKQYSDNFMKLIGFFIGDGYYKGGNYLVFHLRKERKINFLNNLDRKIYKRANDNYYIEISKEERQIFLECYDENREKQIPFNLFRLSKDELTNLYEGLMESDGTKQEGRASYMSTSKKLIEQVQVLGILLGIYPKDKISNYTDNNRKPLGEIRFQNKTKTAEINRVIERKNTKRIQYKGPVFCVEVENHILMVKRNNKISFCGNSTCEHIVFSFNIEGISRMVLQELSRHRIASLSVKSTRYTLKELKNEKPFWDFEDETPVLGAISRSSKYINYSKGKGSNYADINPQLKQLEILRQELNNKKSIDEVKYYLPECYKTNLVWTINARSLKNFLDLRLSKSAHYEIQELAWQILKIVENSEYKILFQQVIDDYTPF